MTDLHVRKDSDTLRDMQTTLSYIYRADLYCSGCILRQCSSVGEITAALSEGIDMDANGNYAVEDVLDVIAQLRDINRLDEWSFDTDDFPKVATQDQLRVGKNPLDDEEGNDPTDRCGHCGKILKEVSL